MRLRSVIEYLDKLDNVCLWQEDVYVDEREPELVFEGSIIDIPWVYLDYWLANNPEGEAISARSYENGKAGFVILIRETPK